MRQVGGHSRTVHNRPLVSSRDHDLESMAIRVRGTADAALSGALLLGVHVPPHDVHEEVAIVPRLLVRDACGCERSVNINRWRLLKLIKIK